MREHEHELSPTTHTIELRQIAELNAALASGRGTLTAGSVGVHDTHAEVPADAVLKSLEAEGPPSWPYVYGHFSRPGAEDMLRVELHTAHLRAISDQLRMRSHLWGT